MLDARITSSLFLSLFRSNKIIINFPRLPLSMERITARYADAIISVQTDQRMDGQMNGWTRSLSSIFVRNPLLIDLKPLPLDHGLCLTLFSPGNHHLHALFLLFSFSITPNFQFYTHPSLNPIVIRPSNYVSRYDEFIPI